MSQFDELPEGWVKTIFAELFQSLQYGYTASASFDISEPKFLRITDIKDYGVNWSQVPGCEIPLEEIKKYLIHENDILFARTGSVEKAWRANNLPIAVFASYLIRGSLVKSELAIWIEHFIRSHNYLDQIGVIGVGTGRKNVNAQNLSKVRLPLPPLNEQRRIVGKIEALTARSGKARAALDEIPALLDQFRQSVLAAAFRGDLTADWRAQNPDIEPAEALLKQFTQDREIEYQQQVKKLQSNNTRIPKLPKVEDQERIVNSPEGWITISVESASIFIIDCLHSTPNFVDSGEYCIDTNCISPFKIDWHSARKVTEEDFVKRVSRLVPEEGDILFSREGTIGIVVKVPANKRLCLGQRMMIFRFSNYILPEYAEMYLQSPIFESQYKPLITGTTSPHLNIGEIRKLKFLVPSINEQKRIISIAKRHLATCESLLEIYENVEAELNQLDRSILAKAFRGELVPQDPTDEPAAVLLDRIRAERERLGSGKKRGRAKR